MVAGLGVPIFRVFTVHFTVFVQHFTGVSPLEIAPNL